MAFKIIPEKCKKCGECASNCPFTAISEEETCFVIDADSCVGCGTCAGTCSHDAIVED